MKKYELYREERQNGLTYQEIADKYGVSKQCVTEACAERNTSYFRFWNSSTCIYPNVRKWLNENMITIAELSRRMGYGYLHSGSRALSCYLSGKYYPPKQTIDKLLSVTNLTYEQFFEIDVQKEMVGDAE